MKRGALVMLRSGGPEMVIERIDNIYGSPDRYATCKWFDHAKLRSDRFAIHTLELSHPAPAQAIEDEDDAVYIDEKEARMAAFTAKFQALDRLLNGGEADEEDDEEEGEEDCGGEAPADAEDVDADPDPPRNGERDRAKRGGGGTSGALASGTPPPSCGRSPSPHRGGSYCDTAATVLET